MPDANAPPSSDTPPRSRPQHQLGGPGLIALVCAFVVGLIWAGWVVMSSRGLQAGMTAYDLTLFRFAVPGVLTLPWLLRAHIWRHWKRVLLIGVGIGVPHALFFQWGLEATSTAHGAIMLPGFVPLFTTLVGWVWLRERPTALAGAGFLLIFAGVILIALPNTGGLANLTLVWPGDLWFLVSALIWGIYTISLKVWPMPPMEAVAVLSVIATVVYIPIWLIWLPSTLGQAPTGEIILQAVYQGFVGILIAVALYAVVVRLSGPQRAAMIAATVPLFTLLLAIVVTNEVPTWAQLAGGAIAGLGIWLVIRLGTRRAPA